MELITGRTGTQHVKAIDDAEIHKSIYGDEDYVLPTGAQLNATRSGASDIIIHNGTAVMQGRQCKIRQSDLQETVTIEAGTVGYKRWDVICIEYNETDGIESAELVVVKGSTSSSWQEPTIQYEDGDIDSGETHRMKLWGVKLDGIDISSLVDYRKIADNNIETIVSDINEISEKVNTGEWISTEPPASPARFSWGEIYAYKNLYTVMVSIELQTSSTAFITTSEDFSIGQLPAEYRPVTTAIAVAEVSLQNTGSYKIPDVTISVYPDGDIRMLVTDKQTGTRGMDYINASLVYITEEPFNG